MALVIASGSNLGNSLEYLLRAQAKLEEQFTLTAASRVYQSKAVDYLDQPDFYNQVLEFALPELSPLEVLERLLSIEKDLGRTRTVSRGPRTIDLDLIFFDQTSFNSEHLILPHPRWQDRSFVVLPFQELPFFQTIEKCFTIPKTFNVDAFPI